MRLGPAMTAAACLQAEVPRVPAAVLQMILLALQRVRAVRWASACSFVGVGTSLRNKSQEQVSSPKTTRRLIPGSHLRQGEYSFSGSSLANCSFSRSYEVDLRSNPAREGASS